MGLSEVPSATSEPPTSTSPQPEYCGKALKLSELVTTTPGSMVSLAPLRTFT